jgi:hypothetical protein
MSSCQSPSFYSFDPIESHNQGELLPHFTGLNEPNIQSTVINQNLKVQMSVKTVQ